MRTPADHRGTMDHPARLVALPLAALAATVLVARWLSGVTGSGYYGLWENAG
jgi:hypothetical protein